MVLNRCYLGQVISSLWPLKINKKLKFMASKFPSSLRNSWSSSSATIFTKKNDSGQHWQTYIFYMTTICPSLTRTMLDYACDPQVIKHFHPQKSVYFERKTVKNNLINIGEVNDGSGWDIYISYWAQIMIITISTLIRANMISLNTFSTLWHSRNAVLLLRVRSLESDCWILT